MTVVDYVQIVENIEDRIHKANCERAFTLSYKQFNCVLTINMGSEKKNQQQPTENAPIMLSNLDTNMLESFGDPSQGPDSGAPVNFTQNCVPFDFDGEKLLWMQYISRDEREVYIYEFASKTKKTILQFGKRDGIISHMKMLGDQLFFVKNTKDIVRHDMKTHSSQLIGTTKDAIISTYVTHNKLREVDRLEEEKLAMGLHDDLEIDEESKGDTRFTLCCLDESESIYILRGGSPANPKKVDMISQSAKSLGNIPQELREKDLFGMGYPYYMSLYGNLVSFSTDYGVVLTKFDFSKVR